MEILDSPAEPVFDRIARIAARAMGAPFAFIALADRDRLWFKATSGIRVRETQRAAAFCSYAILSDEPLVVPDASLDARFRNHPLVTGPPFLKFYAGAPLKRPNGSAFGTLCVLGRDPHFALTPDHLANLAELADLVVEEMQQRVALRRIEAARVTQERRESIRLRLQEAIRQAQSHFISGGEPEIVFGELLDGITVATASRAGCIAEPCPDGLVVRASKGSHNLLPLMELALASLTIQESGTAAAFPVFHGDKIAGVIAWDREKTEDTINLRAKVAPVLDSVAVLFAAAKSRAEGRSAARAIRLRDRALGSITSAVSIVDPRAGSILYANSGFESMSGYSAAELVGRPYSLLNGLDTDATSIRQVEAALAAGDDIDVTLRNYHRDGTAFWNRIRYSPVKDDAGRVDYYVSVADDVTDKIAADAELLRAKIAAERHAQTTSRFMANMSHEIRTPMNGVMGMTGLLLDSQLSEEQRDYAETIHKCADGLLSMINEILDFSRIDSGSVQLELLPFDLSQCIESALDLVASSASRKSINLEYLLDPGVPKTVIGDLTRLRQVLINLLANAVKFTSEGGVLLSASGSRIEGDRWNLHVAIKDTGIGIPPDRIDAIFQPFEQADNSSTRRFGGTGLGLAICKSLVEMMGGRMWVESQMGVGSTFHFTLSIRAEDSHGPDQTEYHLGALQGRRVLVVDPNPSSQLVLRQHLTAWGMDATIYATPGEIPPDLQPGAYDLGIVDNDIPDLSFDQLTVLSGNLPLILLCSLGRRDSGLAAQIRGLAVPRTRLYSKPIKPSYFCETLATFLSGEPARISKVSRVPSGDSDLALRLPFSILVVEDNAINQKLVLLLLSRMGYRADTANNGLEAVHALQRQHYDVVFMDMHMPEMDGLEATVQIRDLLPPERQPWIIALTANAMQTDRDACLRAGMRYFVTKPVQPMDLTNALLAVRKSDAEPQMPPPPHVDGSPELDWILPEYLAELFAEDPETGWELFQVFEADTTTQIAELEVAVRQADWNSTKKLLHSLKGSCAQMGANGIAGLAASEEVKLLSQLTMGLESVVRIRSVHGQMLNLVRCGLTAASNSK